MNTHSALRILMTLLTLLIFSGSVSASEKRFGIGASGSDIFLHFLPVEHSMFSVRLLAFGNDQNAPGIKAQSFNGNLLVDYRYYRSSKPTRFYYIVRLDNWWLYGRYSDADIDSRSLTYHLYMGAGFGLEKELVENFSISGFSMLGLARNFQDGTYGITGPGSFASLNYYW